MEIHKRQRAVWYFALALLATVLVFQDRFSSRRHTETFAYSEVKALLQAGKVRDVVVTDTAITGRLATDGLDGLLPVERLTSIRAASGEDHYFAAAKVDDPDLVADLEAAKARFAGRIEGRPFSTVLPWVVPILLFLALWSLLTRRMSGAEKRNGVTIDDLAAVEEAKAELMEVVELLEVLDRPDLRDRVQRRPRCSG